MFQNHGIWFPDGDGDQFKYFVADASGVWTYQLPKLEAALKFCKRFEVAVDIGAHVGLWSRILAQKFKSVLAFEPIPDFCECFKRNVPGDNVQLFNLALGDNSNGCQLYVRKSDTLVTHICNGVQYPEDLGSYRVSAKMEVLDSLHLDRLDFLKVDVEGFEYPVLLGGIETLKRHRPVIIVEQKGGHSERYGIKDKQALRFLEKLGAKRVWDRGGDYVMVWN